MDALFTSNADKAEKFCQEHGFKSALRGIRRWRRRCPAAKIFLGYLEWWMSETRATEHELLVAILTPDGTLAVYNGGAWKTLKEKPRVDDFDAEFGEIRADWLFRYSHEAKAI